MVLINGIVKPKEPIKYVENVSKEISQFSMIMLALVALKSAIKNYLEVGITQDSVTEKNLFYKLFIITDIKHEIQGLINEKKPEFINN